MNVYYSIMVLTAVVACQFSFPSSNAQEADYTRPMTPTIKVGTFDSRAVAMAYYRSEPFKEKLNALFAEHKEAKERGDLEKSKSLEKRGPELQDLMHRQGFGTWPIDDILKDIEDQLPEIAEKANVDLIVSKWNVTYMVDNLKTIDVTDFLVQPFKPDEATRKVIREIQSKPPVPHEQLKTHK